MDSLFVASRQIGRHSYSAGARTRLGLVALLGLVSCFLLSAVLTAAPAAAACPNEVFRSGPSAKLPDCRAYELVTPEYTAGVKPTATNFSNFPHGFDFPLITAAGDSVSFNTVGGALIGTPGSGFSDRYRAMRTANGWVTKFVGPTTAETERPAPGAVAPDHDLFFFNAGLNEFNLEPEGELQAPFGGKQADYLRLANGENELIGIGSLGSSREADGRLITADDRVIFSAKEQLEPEAAPDGKVSVYERTPGGPTHVLSLLPDGSTPASGANYLGASADANDVAFHVGDGFDLNSGRWYVRRDKSVTVEVARSNGVVVGKELTCAGDGSPTISYQWLRNGAPIGGATGSTYTPTAADAGAAVQCLVEATGAEGGSLAASQPPILVAPFTGKDSPILNGLTLIDTGGTGFVSVGETVSCQPGSWEGDPTFAYQWLRDGAEIAGATGNTYEVTADDLGSVIQCRVTASNGGGATTAMYAGANTGSRFATSRVPNAGAGVPTAGLVFAGVFGGHVFYGDRSAPAYQYQAPGDLYSYDLDEGTTTAITDTGDAQFSHVSRDGSHVYFVSESVIGGEGTSGKPNLYVWSRADGSTTYIATAEPEDAEVRRETQSEYGANLASWAMAMHPAKESVHGLANAYTRATPDGSVFLFMTTAQLTSFNNTEETPEDCFNPAISGERCPELYRFETATEDLTCVSCPPGGAGPAKGRAYTHEWGIVTNLNPPNNLSQDGNMVTFETTEGLLPQDGNERRDVYRWKKGEGLALISTGQEVTDSYIYGVTPNGSDIAFLTTQKLLPQDENGGTERIYDARVNGGFPPPEDTVTEPCSGDACQGNPAAAPEAPSVPSSSLNGAGNVKPKLKCPKGKRKVVRKGKERCVKRKGNKNRRGGKGAGKKAGAKRGSNR